MWRIHFDFALSRGIKWLTWGKTEDMESSWAHQANIGDLDFAIRTEVRIKRTNEELTKKSLLRKPVSNR